MDDRIRISLNGVTQPIGPLDPEERAHLEALVRSDYARLHPGDSFDQLKQRARFAKEDKGLLRDWMELAVRRAAEA